MESGSDSAPTHQPHPPPGRRKWSADRGEHERPAGSRPPSAPVHLVKVLQQSSNGTIARPTSATPFHSRQERAPVSRAVQRPLSVPISTNSTTQLPNAAPESSGPRGLLVGSSAPPHQTDYPLRRRPPTSRPSSALSLQSACGELASGTPVEHTGSTTSMHFSLPAGKVEGAAPSTPSRTDLLSGGISASEEIPSSSAPYSSASAGADPVNQALQLLQSLSHQHPEWREQFQWNYLHNREEDDVPGLAIPTPPSSRPASARPVTSPPPLEVQCTPRGVSPPPRSPRPEDVYDCFPTGRRRLGGGILVFHRRTSSAKGLQPKADSSVAHSAAERFSHKSRAVTPRSPPLETATDFLVDNHSNEEKDRRRNPRERVRHRVPQQGTTSRGKTTQRGPREILASQRSRNVSSPRNRSGERVSAEVEDDKAVDAVRLGQLLTAQPSFAPTASRAARTESNSFLSLQSSGDAGRGPEVSMSPISITSLSTEEIYRNALRSELPEFNARGSHQANVAARQTLQKVKMTLQRLHSSARNQMRHLNQQIDQVCEAIRLLRADIVYKETFQENQRRLKWELHLEQRRRHRLRQLICMSKLSLRRYKQDRLATLEGEVEFCTTHQHSCVFTNRIEASFAAGKLMPHRRLIKSLKTLHEQAEQLSRDLTRTKLERRLVMAQRLHANEFEEDDNCVDSFGHHSNVKKPITFQAFQLVRNALGSGPDEAFYIEDELRRNEVQERDLYRSLEEVRRSVKRKKAEIVELEIRRRNRVDEGRQMRQRVFHSDSRSSGAPLDLLAAAVLKTSINSIGMGAPQYPPPAVEERKGLNRSPAAGGTERRLLEERGNTFLTEVY